jgi:hypothetical protein
MHIMSAYKRGTESKKKEAQKKDADNACRTEQKGIGYIPNSAAHPPEPSCVQEAARRPPLC